MKKNEKELVEKIQDWALNPLNQDIEDIQSRLAELYNQQKELTKTLNSTKFRYLTLLDRFNELLGTSKKPPEWDNFKGKK